MRARNAKSIGSSIINHAGVPTAYSTAKKWLQGSQNLIVMYHRVSPRAPQWILEPPISPLGFETQLNYFRFRYHVVSLPDLVDRAFNQPKSGQRFIAITFDDGYRDNFVYAFPLLRKYRIPVTIFPCTGPLDSPELFWWDKIGYVIAHTSKHRLNLGEFGVYEIDDQVQRKVVAHHIARNLKVVPEDVKSKVTEHLIRESDVDIPKDVPRNVVMSWEDIAIMDNNGISFGAHSVNHPILTNVSSNRVSAEISQSRSRIERHVKHVSEFFAYPDGAFNSSVVKLVQREGFEGAVTTRPVWVTRRSDRFALGRVGISTDDENIFEVVMSGIWGDSGAFLLRR